MIKPFCPECLRRGSQLWIGCCICSGDVVTPFQCPGGRLSHHFPESVQAVPVASTAAVGRLSKKERARLAKHGYFL